MKTFHQFVSEAYDADLMRSASVRTTGAGGRVAPERKKTAPEMRRMSQKSAKGSQGQERTPTSYKPRKDIGSQKGSQTQAPTQERGSARETQLAAAKAERKKAALARIAAKKAGASASAAKPKAKELTAQAKKLTAKKTAAVDKRPADQPKRPVVGMSRAERSRITKAGQRKLKDLVTKAEAEKQGIPASKVKLTGGKSKEKYVTW